MREDAGHLERFEGWVAAPIRLLECLPEGDGAIAALMISLPWYERYIIKRVQRADQEASPENRRIAMAKDLDLTEDQADDFWSVFRTGFMHAGMPKSGQKLKCGAARAKLGRYQDQYRSKPQFMKGSPGTAYAGEMFICLDPWGFARRVVKCFYANPGFLESGSFPLIVGSVDPLDLLPA